MKMLNTLKKAQQDTSATKECSHERSCCIHTGANTTTRWSCRYFQTILAHIQEAVIVVDNYTDEILGANKAFFQLWGIEQYEESVRQGAITASALCKVCQARVRDTIAFAAANALLRDINFREVMRDDVLLVDGRVISCTSTPIPNHQGQCHVRHHAFQDISESKRTENALRASEEYYRTIFENTGTAMVIVEADMTISLANTGFALLVGYTKKEIEGCMSITRFVHEEDRERIKRHHYLRRLNPDAAPRNYELRLQNRHGEVRTMLATVAMIPGTGKSTASFADITEQRDTLEALRMSEERLQLAFAGADDGLWDWNLATGEMYYSDQWAAMLGYYRDELSPNIDAWYHMLHPDDYPQMLETLQAHLEGCTDYFAGEHRLRTKDGEYKWFFTRGKVVARDADGKPLRAVGIHRSIQRRKQLETELLHAQKMEGVGRLAGGVAHDFNNLLTAILGEIDLARLKLEPGTETAEHLENIRESAWRAADLTRQLLAFARKQIVTPQVVSLNDLISNLSKLLRRVIGEDIFLGLQLAEDPWNVKVDPEQFEQVLVNLAVNARDAMPDGGKFTIATGNVTLDRKAAHSHAHIVPGDYVLVTISDTGVGIEKELLQQIFEPFFTTKEKGKGTGLGLAMCYGIVEQNGGHIWCESAAGEGATFKILLPRSFGQPTAQERTSSTRKGGDETLLLVEDEPVVLDAAVRSLRMRGYQVLKASNGPEALRVSREYPEKIHLLVTDMVMPGMNGNELAETLLSERPDMRVLRASGYIGSQPRQSPAQTDSFLQKPYTPSDLAKKVREVLDNSTKA